MLCNRLGEDGSGICRFELRTAGIPVIHELKRWEFRPLLPTQEHNNIVVQPEAQCVGTVINPVLQRGKGWGVGLFRSSGGREQSTADGSEEAGTRVSGAGSNRSSCAKLGDFTGTGLLLP